MKKFLFIVLASFITSSSFSQEATSAKKAPMLSVNFMLNDFRTAERLKNNSLETVLRQKTWAKTTEMSPGLSLQYLQGLSNHVDFMGSLGGSFTNFSFKNEETTSSSNNFLLEADANVNVKLLSDNYIVTPFVTAGLGVSTYKSSFGAYIPTGLGVQFKLSPQSFLFTNFQYRVGITDRSANHFNYSIGFAAPVLGNGTD